MKEIRGRPFEGDEYRKGGQKTLYFNDKELSIIHNIELLLRERDRIRYGQKKVEEFGRKGKYSFSAVVREIVYFAGETFINKLEQDIKELKAKKNTKGRKDKNKNLDPLAKIILAIDPKDDYIWERMEGGY